MKRQAAALLGLGLALGAFGAPGRALAQAPPAEPAEPPPVPSPDPPSQPKPPDVEASPGPANPDDPDGTTDDDDKPVAVPAKAPLGSTTVADLKPRRGPSLSLNRVLRSMNDVHPKLDEAEAKIESAEGKLQSKEGVFDPTAELSVKGLPLGFYDKGRFDALITQESPLWGASFYAGYGRSFGSYPTYDSNFVTLDGGEVRAGVDIPVWRGGPIDRRRADISQAELGVTAAERQADFTRMLLDNAAAYAYWTWVEAGLILDINEALLDVAQQRNDGLNRRIEAGDAPEIEGIDNQRTVLDRQTKVIAARRKLQASAIKLSLYMRDGEGRPRRPARSALPDAIPEPAAPDSGRLKDDIRYATKQRADVRALEAEVEQARVESDLADNQVAPQVNIMGWVAQDIGTTATYENVAVKTSTLRPFDLGVGVKVKIPLLLRKDRGNRRAARGKLGAVRAKTRWARDQVEAEVRQAFANLRAAYETVALARDTREAAEALARAERRKFNLGGSDILYVNLRELYAAEAATKEVKALADYQRALADYKTAAARSLR